MESQVINKFKTGLGYNAISPAVESFVNLSERIEYQENDKSRSDKGYHAVPPPLTGTFMPPKPDIMFIDEQVESESLDVVSNVTPSDVKTVKSKHESVEKNSFRPPIIEDWNSDDEILTRSGKHKTVRPVNIADSKAVNTVRPVNTADSKAVNTVRVNDTIAKERAVVSENKGIWANAIKALACWVWKAKHSSASNTFKKYSYIDARGRSKHMTGNKCYLTEYEEYDGGFVSFRDGKGRISRKCKIKTGSLDFDDVYFCKELKYNLFSVSQMCEKKNNVLFTDTECLVLSSDFKLLDESQVLQ
ncbi:hypothetical protein Tco_1289824 [Tanacetum coccineum]